MIRNLLLVLCITIFSSYQGISQKEYYRDYYPTGALKAEGWKVNGQATAYWYFYHTNGSIAKKGMLNHTKKEGYWYFYTPQKQLIKEGHFIQNKAEKWWIIYDIATSISERTIVRKYQYHNGKKNGFCLLYKNDILFKAERYSNGQKMGEWTDIFSFKKDNPNASL